MNIGLFIYLIIGALWSLLMTATSFRIHGTGWHIPLALVMHLFFWPVTLGITLTRTK